MFINESIYPVDVFDQYVGNVLACSVLGTHDNELCICIYQRGLFRLAIADVFVATYRDPAFLTH